MSASEQYVIAPPPQPSIVLASSGASFTGTVGGTSPAAKQINITNGGSGTLDRLLVLGHDAAKVEAIASEALGRAIRVLTSADVGLDIPATNLNFSDLAAPAGLAALGA